MIFQMYANQIYLGHGTYGFEAASEFYFSKHARDLTLPEAALLAALPKGAEYYSPIKSPDRALARRNLVLHEMYDDHKITKQQEEEAQASPLGLHIEPAPNSVAPYFVEEVRRQLEKEYGAEEVHGAGLRVYTTLDLDLQLVANKAVLDSTAAAQTTATAGRGTCRTLWPRGWIRRSTSIPTGRRQSTRRATITGW